MHRKVKSIMVIKCEKNFPIILKNLMKNKKISHSKIALDCSMAKATLNSYLSGVNVPTLVNAIKLSEYFGITIDNLLGINKLSDR